MSCFSKVRPMNGNSQMGFFKVWDIWIVFFFQRQKMQTSLFSKVKNIKVYCFKKLDTNTRFEAKLTDPKQN